MKTYPFCLLLILCCVASVKIQAQDNIVKSLERFEAGCGTVIVHQDSRLNALLGIKSNGRTIVGETKVLRESGYRVQVYAGGNSREGKSAAHEMEELVQSSFPELPVYVMFASPRWLCQVGDYRTVEEAYAVMRKMKQLGAFNEATIVRSQIIIPL